MANVFISYARSSEALVRRVGEALTAAGHSVWTDAELPPHRAYADVIAERLAAADAVLVLWSADAARSQWVRAEAEHARGRGRLVQATIDGTLPPMPFNQIQCATLDHWHDSAPSAGWRKVLDSVAQLAAADGAAAPRPTPALRWAAARRSRRPWVAAAATAVLVVAVAVAALLVRHPDAGVGGPARVAVVPLAALSDTPATRDAAKAVSDEMFATLNNNEIAAISGEDARTLRGPGGLARLRELGVARLLGGTVRIDGTTVDIKVYLDDPVHHVTLWTGGASGAVGDLPTLRRQVATSTAKVLACANRGLKPGGLTDPTLLTRYLHACDLFANHDDASGPANTFQLLSSLRQVIKGAPDFVPARTDLAKFAAYLAPTVPAQAAGAMRAEAATEADAALAREPKSPDAWLAKAMLLPPPAWAAREAALRRGVAIDPDWPHTNGFLSFLLQETGRMKEAEVYAARAAAADLQIDWAPVGAQSACAAGDFQPATDEAETRLTAHPDDDAARGTAQQCLFDADKIAEACALFDSGSVRPGSSWPLFCRAVATGAPSDRAAAVRKLIEIAGTGGYTSFRAVTMLARLGDLDDAFRIADRLTLGYWHAGTTTAPLFSPRSAALYRDPRFMRLAARWQLVDFWRATGKWPDFCVAPGLPYDCKREAAKVATAK